MIKAIFTDFDWTIYSHKTNRIVPSAKEALIQAHNNNVKLFLATGRGKSEMQMISDYREIPFDGLITLNGQICLDENENKLIGHPMEGKLLENILEIYNSHEMSMVLATEDNTMINFENDLMIEAHKDISYIEHPVKEYEGESVYLAVSYVLEDGEAELKKRLGPCEFKRWGRLGVDIIPHGIDKVSGIEFFLEKYGIDRSECMVLGDSFNDIQMIKYAGIGVAMGNAEQSAKAEADYITSDIDDDGFSKALKHFKVI